MGMGIQLDVPQTGSSVLAGVGYKHDFSMISLACHLGLEGRCDSVQLHRESRLAVALLPRCSHPPSALRVDGWEQHHHRSACRPKGRVRQRT